jgi:hypothetical protein
MFIALQLSYKQKSFQSGKSEEPTNVPIIGHYTNKSSSNSIHENQGVRTLRNSIKVARSYRNLGKYWNWTISVK